MFGCDFESGAGAKCRDAPTILFICEAIVSLIISFSILFYYVFKPSISKKDTEFNNRSFLRSYMLRVLWLVYPHCFEISNPTDEKFLRENDEMTSLT